MQQSNGYIIVFTAVMTLVLGGILATTSVVLKPLQTIQKDLDTKKKIIGAVLDVGDRRSDNEYILGLYADHFSAVVVDYEGNIHSVDPDGAPFVAERIDIQKNHKVSVEDRYAPVFLYRENPGDLEPTAYVFPVFGAGLWDWISGYLAIERDFNTVRGISFDHKSETPGLGARITSDVVQQRYHGKEIFDESGELISVSMIKGEYGNPLNAHLVDGMSGATMTGKGVNSMIESYLRYYLNYMERQSAALNEASLN